MVWLYPHERRQRRNRRLVLGALLLLGFLFVSAADAWLWKKLTLAEGVKMRDWYQALRAGGYLPVWILFGIGLVLHDAREARLVSRRLGPGVLARGVLLVVSAKLSGLIAELAKVVIQRHRPHGDGAYTFAWTTDVPGVGIGTVSSHAAVAFGAAFMLGRLNPAWRWPALFIATGCGLSRLFSGAHFASDVYAAAVVSYAVAWMLPLPARTPR